VVFRRVLRDLAAPGVSLPPFDSALYVGYQTFNFGAPAVSASFPGPDEEMMAYQSSVERDDPERAVSEDVNEGLRLVKSFRRIKNPARRQELLELAEELAVAAERE
jgi:hypothetical protein